MWWRPRGYSMWPAISDGDRILVGPLAPGGPRLGDVVQFPTVEGTTVHRVVGTSRRGGQRTVLVAGDNTTDRPEAVPSGQLMARVIAVEHGGVVRGLDTARERIRAVGRALRRRFRRSGGQR